MRNSVKLATAAIVAAATLALTTPSAMAWIVCNRDGQCWHARQRWVYRAEYGVVVHPDTWAWRPGDRFVWREHPGRGYWRGGVWISF
jgi:hypothetical protein